MNRKRPEQVRWCAVAVTAIALGAPLLLGSCASKGTSGSSAAEAERARDMASIFEAAAGGRRSRVITLLDRGVPIDARNDLGQTPLHVASMKGHDELAGALISRGAPVDAVDNNGDTPLHLAAAGGHDGTARTLLGGGASRTILNKAGKSPVDVASARFRARVF